MPGIEEIARRLHPVHSVIRDEEVRVVLCNGSRGEWPFANTTYSYTHVRDHRNDCFTSSSPSVKHCRSTKSHGLVHQLRRDGGWMVHDRLSHELPVSHEFVASRAFQHHVVHTRLADGSVTDSSRVGAVHSLAAFIEEIVVGITGVLGPFLTIASAGVVAVEILDIQTRNNAVGQACLQGLADEVRRGLFGEPHGHSISAASAAHHVTMVIQHHVQIILVCQVQNFMQTAQKIRVQAVHVLRLGTSPHDA
mmetsp:Transcript_13482/g.22128  ORF Transcript_13482/g.22128 Transcript_13482/m.22128 type:complete len:250 (-) Transcript_13482:355-1104(-)